MKSVESVQRAFTAKLYFDFDAQMLKSFLDFPQPRQKQTANSKPHTVRFSIALNIITTTFNENFDKWKTFGFFAISKFKQGSTSLSQKVHL